VSSDFPVVSDEVGWKIEEIKSAVSQVNQADDAKHWLSVPILIPEAILTGPIVNAMFPLLL